MSAELVRLDRVSKAFRGRVAVDALSLAVGRGEVLALLGPNGAGKSTTLALVLGHLRPTSGDVFIRGVSVVRNRRRALRGVGVVLETPAFHDYLSGWENLGLLASYSAAPDPAAMLDAVRFVGLEARIHDRVRAYSHGMRQRLALAQALVPAPDVVLLDEPAEGLDPEGVATMHRMVHRLSRERDVTVVIASHLLAEVEPVCDRVAILARGRLVFDGRWDEAGAGPAHVRLHLDDWERARPILLQAGATPIGPDVVALAPGVEVADVVAALVRGGLRVDAVAPIRRTLAEIYRQATAAPPGCAG